MMATGLAPAQIDCLDTDDVNALHRHMRSVPPAYVSIAVMAGTYREPESDVEITPKTASEIASLIDTLNAGALRG